MAVKVNPNKPLPRLAPALEELVDLTSVDVLVGKGVTGVNTLPLMIRKVSKNGSKYTPRSDGHVSAITKQSKSVATGTEQPAVSKKPTKPVLVNDSSELSAEKDELANYAAWLEFHNPPRNKKGQPLMASYPVDPKEKRRMMRITRDSQQSKAHMQTLRAVGVTPRAHVGKPEASTKYVEPSWEYFKEEILPRHLERESMERELIDQFVAVSCDMMYWEEYGSPGIEMKIERLENHINESSSSEPVEFVGPMPVVTSIDQCYTPPCDLIERQSYGLEISDEQRYYHWLQVKEDLPPSPSLADQVFSKLFTQHSRYIYALVHCYNWDWKGYASWLSTKGKDSTYVRNHVEYLNKKANPYHELDLGEDIHPLAQFAPHSFEWSMDRMQAHRHSNIMYDLIGCDHDLGSWLKYVNNTTPMPVVDVKFDEATVKAAIEDNDKRMEEYAERVVNRAIRKESGFAQWSQNIDLGRTRMQMLRHKLKAFRNQRYENYYQFWSWATNVEAEVLKNLDVPWNIEGDDGMATVTIDMTPANDATVSSDTDSPTELLGSAEVVDLASVRSKQSNEVLSLSSKLKARLTERIQAMSDEELKVVEQLFKAE